MFELLSVNYVICGNDLQHPFLHFVPLTRCNSFYFLLIVKCIKIFQPKLRCCILLEFEWIRKNKGSNILTGHAANIHQMQMSEWKYISLKQHFHIRQHPRLQKFIWFLNFLYAAIFCYLIYEIHLLLCYSYIWNQKEYMQ